MLCGWEVFDSVVLVLSEQALDGTISITFILVTLLLDSLLVVALNIIEVSTQSYALQKCSRVLYSHTLRITQCPF